MFTNSMTRLINKVSHILEVDYIEQFFPDEIKKDKWAQVIIDQSLLDFSKYVPHQVQYLVKTNTLDKDGWYYVDEEFLPGNIKIVGVKDLDFEAISVDATMSSTMSGPYGIHDYMQSVYSVDDIANIQMMADTNSLFNCGIFVEWKSPNKIRLKSASRNYIKWQAPTFPITLYLTHSENLLTIDPTKMELLEELASCDIAKFLYGTLKYFDHFETTSGNIELKLDVVEDYKNKRDDILQKLKDGFVGAGGTYPLIMTV